MRHMQFAPPSGDLFRKRVATAQANQQVENQRPSAMRKISFAKRQMQSQKQLDHQRPIPDEISKLSGLQRIMFVIAVPVQNDILLAGPAQGWVDDADGRTVGTRNRRRYCRS